MPPTRARIGAAACDTARSVDYVGAGTVEFIVSADRPDEFFFMEMNTRLQVEHPVTEMVTGWDLVEWQVRIAAGEQLPVTQDDIVLTGHAIEARVYAEDPAARLPADRRAGPGGRGTADSGIGSGAVVRVDSGLAAGMTVGSDYDPMLAKVIVHADDRAAALGGLDRALADTAVLGVGTNIDFLRFVLSDKDVAAGQLDTELLERLQYIAPDIDDEAFIAAAIYRWLRDWPATASSAWDIPGGWRLGEHAGWTIRLSGGERTDHVHIVGTPQRAEVWVEGGKPRPLAAEIADGRLVRNPRRHPRANFWWPSTTARSGSPGSSAPWCSRRCGRPPRVRTTNTRATPISSVRCRVRLSPWAFPTERRSRPVTSSWPSRP